MDAGRIEVEAAAKAGAQIIDVFGTATDATIEECVRRGQELRGPDRGGPDSRCPTPWSGPSRWRSWARITSRVHVAIDEQMRGRDPFTILKAVSEAVENSRGGGRGHQLRATAAAAVAHGAAYVIVGGAITKAQDPRAAPREIRRALDEGVVIPTTLFKRAGKRIFAGCWGRFPRQPLRRPPPGRGAAGLAPPVSRHPHGGQGPHRAHLPGGLGQAGGSHRYSPARGRAGHRRGRGGPAIWGELGRRIRPSKKAWPG